MKAKMIKAYHHAFPAIGEILTGRKLFNGLMDTQPQFQCTEGKWSGAIIPYEFYIVLPTEQTYSAAEYESMQVKYNGALADIAKHGQTIRKLTQNEECLFKELDAAEKALGEACEAKKVVLPREVAEAFDFFKSEGADGDDILRWVENQADGKHIDKIRGYIRDGKGFDIAAALVNGYTVEEPVDPIKQAVDEICNEFDVAARSNVNHDDIRALAFRVANRVQTLKEE